MIVPKAAGYERESFNYWNQKNTQQRNKVGIAVLVSIIAAASAFALLISAALP